MQLVLELESEWKGKGKGKVEAEASPGRSRAAVAAGVVPTKPDRSRFLKECRATNVEMMKD